MSKKIPLTAQIGDSEIRLLRIFVTVVDCGGFSPAEVELNVSRSAISISMGNLEKRLGLRLCSRGRSGFSLTPEGREVYQAALQILASLDEFRTHINTLHTHLKGDLRIGITDNLVSLQHMRITDAVRALKSKGPDVHIQIRMVPPADVERGVLDGSLHVGVVPEVRPLPGLEYHGLYDEESRLYCSSAHPIASLAPEDLSISELSKWDAVVPAYEQTREIKTVNRFLKNAATSSDREGIAFLILSDKYIGFLPTHFAWQWERDGRILPIALPEHTVYTTRYSAIVRQPRPRNMVLDSFIDSLLQTPEVLPA